MSVASPRLAIARMTMTTATVAESSLTDEPVLQQWEGVKVLFRKNKLEGSDMLCVMVLLQLAPQPVPSESPLFHFLHVRLQLLVSWTV